MMRRIVNKDKLKNKLVQLLKEFEIIGPKNLSGKGIFYQTISEVEDLFFGDDFTVEPVKKFFLEPSSYILRYEQANGMSVKTAQKPHKKRIVIGVRPCEARGLALLDNVFGGDYKDSFYVDNRERTTIVGLACNKPDGRCFCTSMDGAPCGTVGMDALLIFYDGEFAIEVITEKGKEIFGSLGEEPDEDQINSLESQKEEAKNLVRKRINPNKDFEKIFEADYWDEVSKPCVSCGICTYLCPTCHCFDLVDEERKRLRCYDGCSFLDFTLEASGVNPRPTKRERYRQRLFHKFDYFKRNFGENLCVGCGRCIHFCPVKIDIAEIVDKMPVTSN